MLKQPKIFKGEYPTDNKQVVMGVVIVRTKNGEAEAKEFELTDGGEIEVSVKEQWEMEDTPEEERERKYERKDHDELIDHFVRLKEMGAQMGKEEPMGWLREEAGASRQQRVSKRDSLEEFEERKMKIEECNVMKSYYEMQNVWMYQRRKEEEEEWRKEEGGNQVEVKEVRLSSVDML
jgi:hypothetical protein